MMISTLVDCQIQKHLCIMMLERIYCNTVEVMTAGKTTKLLLVPIVEPKNV